MATNLGVSITDDVKAGRIVDAMAANYGWQAKVPDPAFVPTSENPVAPMIDNPVNKVQFARDQVRKFLLDNVKSFETQDAAEKARKKASDKVDADSLL
jgi:hypothetical protein